MTRAHFLAAGRHGLITRFQAEGKELLFISTDGISLGVMVIALRDWVRRPEAVATLAYLCRQGGAVPL